MVTFLKSLRRPEADEATTAAQRERSVAREYAALEALAERLVAGDPEVLGVFPTYVADEDWPEVPR